MKNKILYVITKGNFGGAQKYVLELATAMKESSAWEPVVALGEGNILESKLAEQGIRVIKLTRSQRDVNLLKDFTLLFDLIRLYRRERPSVVHLNSSKIGGVGALAARIYNLLTPKTEHLKAIFTVHGWAFNEARPDWEKIVIKFLHWITVIFCHQVICIAKREYDQLANWPGAKNKLVVIYNGQAEIDFKAKLEARQFLLSKTIVPANIPDTALWAGTISELHRNKGLDYAVLAIKEFNKNNPAQPLAFFIIGEGEERVNLEQLIESEGLGKSVFLLGHIDNAKSYLKALDIFTLTSRKEGLPYVLLEAGLAELPVISSNVGGISEILDTDKTGLLIRPGHPKEIKIAMEKLVFDAKLRQTLGQNLAAKVRRDFSMEQMVEKTMSLY